MARIVVITHEHDPLVESRGLARRRTSGYMAFDILAELTRRGHSWRESRGPGPAPAGDVAILHVNATIIPPDYVAYARTFPFCLNLGTLDISKRRISGAMLRPDEAWSGPVIVKSNLNHSGLPETRLNRRALRAGQAEPFPGARAIGDYRIYEAREQVPAEAFADPGLCVERFVPEIEPDGHALRFWIFCGAAERCTRYVSPNRLVKGAEVVRREPVPVPEELRARRRELGFDYGKFDFVVHEGRAILLDANRTPGRPPTLQSDPAVGPAHLADGFERLMRQVL